MQRRGRETSPHWAYGNWLCIAPWSSGPSSPLAMIPEGIAPLALCIVSPEAKAHLALPACQTHAGHRQLVRGHGSGRLLAQVLMSLSSGCTWPTFTC